MKFKDVVGLTISDLRKQVQETREELFNMKMKNIMGQQVTNPLKVRMLRRDIAKLLTAIGQKAVSEKTEVRVK
ncbi:MAG: 50S ribosomal protein L29 [Pseudomonadota bacterium]|nr:50S ribosomal protein L29 [Pseudomonadota bacterium]